MRRNLNNSSYKDICEMMRGNPKAIQFVYDFLYHFTGKDKGEDDE